MMGIVDALDKEYKTATKMLYLLIHANTSGAELVELHQAHFAHSNVHDVNIIVRKDGKPGFMFVDFNWAGVIGKVH